MNQSKPIPGITLTNTEILLVSQAVQLEPATLKAVQTVETAGRGGFLSPLKPIILFEGHIFWKMLLKHNINPRNHLKGNEDILYQKWDRKHYVGGAGEYDRLERACRINQESAYLSASWGMFQVMGFNHKSCGVNSIYEFVRLMGECEYRQLKLTVSFLVNSNMIASLRQKDWDTFARAYNGPLYRINHYAEKLAVAYKAAKKIFR